MRTWLATLSVGIVVAAGLGGVFWHHATPNGNADVSWPFSSLDGSSQQLPGAMRKKVESSLGSKPYYRLRFDQSHFHRTSIKQQGIWVVGGPEVVCIVQAGRGAVSCARRGAVVREGVTLGVGEGVGHRGRPKWFMILGVAPDSVNAIRVTVLGKG